MERQLAAARGEVNGLEAQRRQYDQWVERWQLQRPPTYGVRDGGVADSFGDYRKIGFDCSGLMMYAFAGAGVYLPHYSGYQYNSGRKMVEAPHSGAVVRISPVRYGGIMPFVAG